MRNRTIMYAYNTESGMCISRVDSEVAIPVLEYGKMVPENNFQTSYKLEKCSVHELAQVWSEYKWTRKIPFTIKNMHRKFWGMPELKRRPNSHELTAKWKGLKFRDGERVLSLLKVVPGETASVFDKAHLKIENPTNMFKAVEWQLNDMVKYLKENPTAVIHSAMGLMQEQAE